MTILQNRLAPIPKLQNNDTNTSFQNFFDSMSRILDKYDPLKKLSKYKIKFKTKPWITHDTIKIYFYYKNKLFSDLINKKRPYSEN